VTLQTAGPCTATNVQIVDLLPTGLTFLGASPSQGTYNSTTGFWLVGAVGTVSAPTLKISARMDSSGPETNTATVSDADQYDPNPANNSAGATVTPAQAA